VHYKRRKENCPGISYFSIVPPQGSFFLMAPQKEQVNTGKRKKTTFLHFHVTLGILEIGTFTRLEETGRKMEKPR